MFYVERKSFIIIFFLPADPSVYLPEKITGAMIIKKYKTGIVLSGGAARGFAHVGVLKALNEAGIYPDVISGVSAGAIVGSLYADGYKPDEIIEIFGEKKMFNFIRLAIPNSGLARITGMEEVMREHLRAKKFQDLEIPFFVAATNYNKGEIEYFNEGELLPRIIASASIPVLFAPVKIGDYSYVDGGVIDNMPLEPLKGKCRKIIGVHVNPTGYTDEAEGIMKIAVRSFHLSVSAEINNKINSFNPYIEPEKLRNYGLLDVGHGREMFQIGYEKAKEVISEKTNIRKRNNQTQGK